MSRVKLHLNSVNLMKGFVKGQGNCTFSVNFLWQVQCEC